jgi:hypothetical protein
MARSLLATRRILPLDRLEEYVAGWERLRGAVTEQGGHAWLFRAAAREDHFLEFIEFRGPDALHAARDVHSARTALSDEFGEREAREWLEFE